MFVLAKEFMKSNDERNAKHTSLTHNISAIRTTKLANSCWINTTSNTDFIEQLCEDDSIRSSMHVTLMWHHTLGTVSGNGSGADCVSDSFSVCERGTGEW